ncbi:MAG TPA: methyltransferase domain-containing protein [Burkholderiales bacterium]|nr:methyltransferase domain-containing protein [Burkholderiales bacterium]
MDPRTFQLDARQARRAFDRAARIGADTAVLQSEVERRMFERLDYIRLQPARVLDAGCGTGRGLGLLRRRYPKADLLGVDFAPAALLAARRSESLVQRARYLLSGPGRFRLCADFSRLPLRNGCIDLVWSNLALAWAVDPLAALGEFRRVLATGGLLMFSSYGPDTLKELKTAFAAGSSTPHVHSFADMHDVGDMLVSSGFAEPVMDMETITLTYPDVALLARDLKVSGQTCAVRDRGRGLSGRSAWRSMREAYERERRGGKLPATIELVYGHAWKGEPRIAADGRQVIKWETKITR